MASLEYKENRAKQTQNVTQFFFLYINQHKDDLNNIFINYGQFSCLVRNIQCVCKSYKWPPCPAIMNSYDMNLQWLFAIKKLIFWNWFTIDTKVMIIVVHWRIKNIVIFYHIKILSFRLEYDSKTNYLLDFLRKISFINLKRCSIT